MKESKDDKEFKEFKVFSVSEVKANILNEVKGKEKEGKAIIKDIFNLEFSKTDRKEFI